VVPGNVEILPQKRLEILGQELVEGLGGGVRKLLFHGGGIDNLQNYL